MMLTVLPSAAFLLANAPLAEPTLGPDAAAIRDALSRLQLAYVQAGGVSSPAPSAGQAPAAEPGGPGPAQSSGRLWVPGQ